MSSRPGARTLGAVDELFTERHRGGGSPGLVYAVHTRDGIAAYRGFGRYDDTGNLPGADTAFRVASCTKSFTAAVVVILRDRGLLGLDDVVARYVPALSRLRVSTPDSPRITVRMLLTMSAGLPTDNEWADRQESLSAAGFHAMLRAGFRFTHTPDTAFEYSNLGYALLGQVIEAVTGRSYIEVVSTELLGPLGLASTGFDAGVPAGGGVATGYRKLERGWEGIPFSAPGAFSPIGGIFSTVTDLGRWAGWLGSAFDGGAATDADVHCPLSQSSRRELQQLHRAILPASVPLPGSTARTGQSAESTGVANRGYGYGLFVELDSRYGLVVSHSGGYPGFGSHMRWHPGTGLAVIGFENAKYAAVRVPAVRALDLLLDERFAAEDANEPVLWPETRAAGQDVESLIRQWDDALAERIFASNVALDEPWESRRRQLAAAVADIGPLTGDAGVFGAPVRSSSPAHLVWTMSAERGALECEILLHPLDPPRIQLLKIAAVPAR